MKKRTVRLILDCMICDAMSPEFKKANDILLRIIKEFEPCSQCPE